MKSRSSITYLYVIQSFWNFPQSTALSSFSNFCTEHGSDTVVLCAKFQNDWTTERDMDKRHFARFEFGMSCGQKSYIFFPGSYNNHHIIMRRFMCTRGNCCSSNAYTVTISYENKLLLLLLFILFLLKWYYHFHYHYNYYYHCCYHNHYHYYHYCHPHHRHHVSVILNYQPLAFQGLDLVLQQSNQIQHNITHSSTAINLTFISDF